jgi:hypothetical protein
MSGEIDPVEYGKLIQQVEQLGKDVHEMRVMMANMNDFMQQSKGGWKTIVLLSGVAGSVGAAIAWFVSHMKG